MNTKLKQEQKFCNKCETTLPLSAFYADKTSVDGKQRYCKSCVKNYQNNFTSKYSKKNITRLLSDPKVSIQKLRNYFGVYVEEEEE